MVTRAAFAGVDAVLDAATAAQYTGAVARIEHRGRPVYERAVGTTRADELARDVCVDSRFDLASLTKPFVATVALTLVDESILALDTPLTRLVPEWSGTGHATITLRMLLAHNSGMHSGADYRTILDENVERFALNRELDDTPGERVTYSDLGFIALGTILERATGRNLATMMRERFDSETLRYGVRLRDRSAIPATESDAWRGRVQGTVHDEKAHLMGGVVGHAGLFGTAADVAGLAEMYLAPRNNRGARGISAALAREAISEQAFDPVLRRGLGWALKTRDDNSCGRFMHRESFGHTGFVGTCVWADPIVDVAAVLLTNSVYFGRSDTRPLRAAFFEAAMRALGLA
ncbi:MAG TPA: serine hydrolase [Candidatus Tumulicola sp.]